MYLRLYVNDIAFSHFSWNVMPRYLTGSKKVVSVSDISVVNFIASRARAVGLSKFTCSVNLNKSTMSGLLMSHREKYHLCSVFKQLVNNV